MAEHFQCLESSANQSPEENVVAIYKKQRTLQLLHY